MAPRNIFPELVARGLVADVTNREELEAALAAGDVPHYVGHDPTADSLHVGHLVPVSIQRHLQLAGHSPFALVGGATGMIGDPSGKSEERNLLDREVLAHNVARIHAQLSRLLASDEQPVRTVNNFDFYAGMNVLDFLRDVGKHFTVNHMMAKESVRARLEDREAGISFTEFSYMLLQAYDFVTLARQGCRLQVGGSDQWGNITAGCELSRKLGGPQLYGLTAPLLLDSTGQKMGKTSTGERVWLDATRTTPYAFYQYFFNVADADAPRLLRLFSLAGLPDLEALSTAHDADRGKRLAQRELARVMTTWVHGAAAIAPIEAAAQVMFGGSLEGITEDVLGQLVGTMPTVELPRAELATGLTIVDLLARTVADSKGAARRLVTQGGAYVNNVRIGEPDATIGLGHLATATMLVVRGGKKDYRLVRVVG